MAKFHLTNKAVEDLSDIWDYTVENWSENQAEIYYSMLIESCRFLSNLPNQGKSYEIVERNILGYKTGQHIIFYRIMNKKEIEVIRILHGKMDLKSHL
jgi:toxin ParE1/3/4